MTFFQNNNNNEAYVIVLLRILLGYLVHFSPGHRNYSKSQLTRGETRSIFVKVLPTDTFFHLRIHLSIFCEVSSIFTFSSRFARKAKLVQKHPKKLETSPTTHVIETSFLHVLDSPDLSFCHVGCRAGL